MKCVENDCVGCPSGMPCLGSSCPYMNVTHFYCDECKDEAPLYEYDGEELCIECIKNRLSHVEGSAYD